MKSPRRGRKRSDALVVALLIPGLTSSSRHNGVAYLVYLISLHLSVPAQRPIQSGTDSIRLSTCLPHTVFVLPYTLAIPHIISPLSRIHLRSELDCHSEAMMLSSQPMLFNLPGGVHRTVPRSQHIAFLDRDHARILRHARLYFPESLILFILIERPSTAWPVAITLGP